MTLKPGVLLVLARKVSKTSLHEAAGWKDISPRLKPYLCWGVGGEGEDYK